MRKQVAWGIVLIASLLTGTAWAQESLNEKLWFAVERDDTVGIEAYIAHGADVNAKREDGSRPLHSVAGSNWLPAAELLIAKGADVNATDGEGRTPLWYAVHDLQKDMVLLLIADGADVSAEVHGQTLIQALQQDIGNESRYGTGAEKIENDNLNREIQAILKSASSAGNSRGDLQKSMAEFELRKLVSDFKTYKGMENDALRAAIIDLALKQRPTIPPEAEAAAGRGAYIFKNSNSVDDKLNAAKEYLKAIEAAPWVANYYYNLCTVLEKTPYTQQALHACKLYLVAAPNAADAGDMKQRIAGLQYAADKDKAQMKQRTAYGGQNGAEILYRYGGISGTVSGKDIALKLLVEWNSAPPKYQIYTGCFNANGVNGMTYDLVSTDSRIGMCNPVVSMHLVIKPEGEGFVQLSDASGGSLRTTLNELFDAKQKTMARANLFHAGGAEGQQHFYVAYAQAGNDNKHTGFAMYESDCNGSVLKQDPRALPSDLLSFEILRNGGWGRFVPEMVSSQPSTDVCARQFASKTGYHFGEKE